MSAVEIARLANIALAEIGHPETIVADGARLRSGGSHKRGRSLASERKAYLLAIMTTDGPSHPVTCPGHDTRDRWAECPKVPVADALRGRLCLNAGTT